MYVGHLKTYKAEWSMLKQRETACLNPTNIFVLRGVQCCGKMDMRKVCGNLVGFEVLTAVSLKIAVFLVVAVCSLVEVYRYSLR